MEQTVNKTLIPCYQSAVQIGFKTFIYNPKFCVHFTFVFQKGVLDFNFNQAVIDKISIFHEIAPNFTYSQKLYFLNV